VAEPISYSQKIGNNHFHAVFTGPSSAAPPFARKRESPGRAADACPPDAASGVDSVLYSEIGHTRGIGSQSLPISALRLLFSCPAVVTRWWSFCLK